MNDFLKDRTMLYIDSDTLAIRLAPSKYSGFTIAQWFRELNYPYYDVIRGYYWGRLNKDMDKVKTSEEFVMIYQDNYQIPNLAIRYVSYLFQFFPNIDWVGLGCNIGKDNEIWTPQFKIYRVK